MKQHTDISDASPFDPSTPPKVCHWHLLVGHLYDFAMHRTTPPSEVEAEPQAHRPDRLHLLTLPVEIRLTLYHRLFQCPHPIKIESAHEEHHGFDDHESDNSTIDSLWALRRPTTPREGLSAQFLAVCRDLHAEGLPYLYGVNTFDCSSRSALPLLLRQLLPTTSALIRHVVLDWEQLQDFAGSLAKPEQVAATHGLQVLDLATWRMRVLGGSSSRWRDVKDYERQLCEAALDICEKHPLLCRVLQRPFHRSTRAGDPVRTTHRIKWRFVTEVGAVTGREDGERIVDLHQELALLTPVDGIVANISSVQDGMDPI